MKRFAQIVTFLTIPLLIAVMVNQSVNCHYHKLESGRVVAHAHPFSKSTDSPASPFQKHKHSQIQLFFLSHWFNLVVLFVIVGIFIPDSIFQGIAQYIPFYKRYRNVLAMGINGLRAPPSI